MLSEGNQHVLNYKVTEKTLPEAMSVVFVIPRSRDAAGGAFFQGVLDCLRWKRPGDPWSILPYIEAGVSEPPPPRDPEPPVFTTNAETLAALKPGRARSRRAAYLRSASSVLTRFSQP